LTKTPAGFSQQVVHGIDVQGHYTPLILLLGDENKDRLPRVGEWVDVLLDNADIGKVEINEQRSNGVGASLSTTQARDLIEAVQEGAKTLYVFAARSHYVFVSDQAFKTAVTHLTKDCPTMAAQLNLSD
jgi:hypothetical protein